MFPENFKIIDPPKLKLWAISHQIFSKNPIFQQIYHITRRKYNILIILSNWHIYYNFPTNCLPSCLENHFAHFADQLIHFTDQIVHFTDQIAFFTILGSFLGYCDLETHLNSIILQN